MKTPALRLAVYDLVAADGFVIPDNGQYFLFAAEDAATITTDGKASSLPSQDGRFLTAGDRISGTGWIFELARKEMPYLPAPSCQIQLATPLDFNFDGPFFVRADAVTSPAGAQTPCHGHRGPGIRRLLKGRLLAQMDETIVQISAGQAWYESQQHWIIGTNINQDENTFIRVMVLPSDLTGGQSSFVPFSPEEAKKKRDVRYHLFGETEALNL